jgi:hypothetical protein
MSAKMIYEDYTASIAQSKEVYIKKDDANHISSKLFFTHDLQNNGDKDIQQILSSDDLAYCLRRPFRLQSLKSM